MLHSRRDSFVPNRVYLVVLYGNTENVNNSCFLLYIGKQNS